MRVVQNEPAKVPFHEVGKDRCYFGWLQLGFRKWRVLISFCLLSWWLFLRILTNSKVNYHEKPPFGEYVWYSFPTTSSKSKSMKTDSTWFNLPTPDWPRHEMITCDQLIAIGPKWTISGPLLFWKVTVEICDFSRGYDCYPTQIINELFQLHYTQLLSLGSKCSNKIHQKKWMFG